MAGWSALTFHPVTLDTTKKLKYLWMISGSHVGQSFIPPPQELERSFGTQYSDNSNSEQPTIPPIIRPRWSWGWDLPALTEIHFSSEFAYRFQFRMLRGCPALDVLYLDIGTTDDVEISHSRTITNADLFALPPSSSPSSLDSSVPEPLPERIVATHLKKLFLVGRWIVNDDVILAECLTGMFPNLDTFTEKTKGGFTFENMLNLIRVSSSPSPTVCSSEEIIESHDADISVGGGSGGSNSGSLELLRWSPLKLRALLLDGRFTDVPETMNRWGLYPRSHKYQYKEQFDGLDVLPTWIFFEDMACFILHDPIV